MQISTSSGKSFSVNNGETLLSAALSAGVVLEHSCMTGRCGTCKAHVDAGSTMPIHDESGLSQAELGAGWILTCARIALSDVQLDIEDLGEIQLYPIKTLPCRILSLELLGADIMRVILRFPPNLPFNYHPGQYIDVIGGGGLRRSYSIANAPCFDNFIELHIRQVPEGLMSHYWFDEAKTNDLLRISGPLGTFFLRDVAGQDVILLATGTGIAPIKAILEGMTQMPTEQRPRSIKVYWGGRVAQDLYWDPNETGLELQYTPVLSRPDAIWNGARGHVQQAVLSSGINLEQSIVYACGSLTMIESARSQLLAAGLNIRRFYSDAFVSSSQNLKEKS